jgi:hypothetical protein
MKLGAGFGSVNYSCVSSIQLCRSSRTTILWRNTSVLTADPMAGRQPSDEPMVERSGV